MENKDIENIFFEGASKYNSGKYVMAIDYFNKAIVKDELYCEPYYGRGRYELGRYKDT